MGEAKRRGTFEQRLASVLERKAKLESFDKPNFVKNVTKTHGRNRHIEMALCGVDKSVSNTKMNPCIIIFNRVIGRFEAYNEDGRAISFSYYYNNVVNRSRDCGYSPVYLNSRIGRTIFDHLPLNVQMQQTTKS